jgi:hypothetical protein
MGAGEEQEDDEAYSVDGGRKETVGGASSFSNLSPMEGFASAGDETCEGAVGECIEVCGLTPKEKSLAR